jgi:hypothetical protein
MELKIEYMVGLKKDNLKFKQPLFLHFYLPADYTLEGLQKYIVSFSFDDCLQVLNTHNIVWHQFANPKWGLVIGDLFIWNDWEYHQGNFAIELLNRISTGELNLHDSIDQDASLARVKEYLEFDIEEEPYVFYLRKIPGYSGVVQIMHSSWGLSEVEYITTVDIASLLGNWMDSDGFMSYGQALSQGKLSSIQGSEVDTLSHNGVLTGLDSPIQISEIKNAVVTLQNPILDYKTGTYGLVVTELANLNTDDNNMLLQTENEISGILIDKVRDGSLRVFANDSLTTELTIEEFNRNLTRYYEEWGEIWYDEWDSTLIYSSWDGAIFNDIEYQSLIDNNQGISPEGNPEAWMQMENEIMEYAPSEVSMLQITYRYIFSGEGKMISYEPITLGLNVSPEFVESGLMMQVGTFNFQDVSEVFSEDPRTEIKVNGESRNMADIIKNRQLKTYHLYSRYLEYNNK